MTDEAHNSQHLKVVQSVLLDKIEELDILLQGAINRDNDHICIDCGEIFTCKDWSNKICFACLKKGSEGMD